MSGALKALLLVVAIAVVGTVSWYLGGGSRTAARDSARCLDPRQPGCQPGAGGAHPAAGLAPSGSWRTGGVPARPRDARPGKGERQDFAVAQAVTIGVESPKIELGAGRSPSGAALSAALADLVRELPEGATQRSTRGVPGDPSASLVEYIDRGGEVIFRVLSGRGGVVAADYDRGLRYELERDGTVRRDAALVDPSEAAPSRARRLTRRWGLPQKDAEGVSRSAEAAGAFVDLRRAGLPAGPAARWAQQAASPLPKFADWSKRTREELGTLDDTTAGAYYAWLQDVPVLGRLAAAALGEPPVQVARRFGFDGQLLRQFMEGATGDDLRLGRLAAVPARIRGDTPLQQKSLRALVGDPQVAATLPLSLGSLQDALERPAQLAARLADLPPAYPYLLLAEESEGRRRPLLLRTATLLSWVAPVAPDDADALARLRVLPSDAPVALQAALPASAAQALLQANRPAGAEGQVRLRAFALAGPLRDLLEAERRPWARAARLFDAPQERPPAAYFGAPPFLYSSLSVEGSKGEGRVLARRGIPTGALLRLDAEQAGLPELEVSLPPGAPPSVRGALVGLGAAYGKASASVQRHRPTLALSTAGREVLERWSLLESQVALVGLAVSCALQGRCPLAGLARPEDGALLLTSLRRGLAGLRPRILLSPIERADAAELADRMGELLRSADRAAATLEPQRPFLPAARAPAVLARMAAYIRAATGEGPRPDPAKDGALLVRDVPLPRYQELLLSWERGARLPEDLDAEILALRRDRGDVPATLGELVQRYGAALQEARPAHIPAGQARARTHRRVRLQLLQGGSRLALVQTMDDGGHLRDVEVLIEQPGGELDGFSYDGDGKLITQPGAAPIGGGRCLPCHTDAQGGALLSPPATWRPGAGGATWLTPVLAAELAKTAAARRAAELR